MGFLRDGRNRTPVFRAEPGALPLSYTPMCPVSPGPRAYAFAFLTGAFAAAVTMAIVLSSAFT